MERQNKAEGEAGADTMASLSSSSYSCLLRSRHYLFLFFLNYLSASEKPPWERMVAIEAGDLSSTPRIHMIRLTPTSCSLTSTHMLWDVPTINKHMKFWCIYVYACLCLCAHSKAQRALGVPFLHSTPISSRQHLSLMLIWGSYFFG